MPTIYVKPQYSDQDGYVTDYNVGSKYVADGLNYGVRPNRLGLVRFTHVPVPKGSTITDAKLYHVTSVKNDGAQSIWYRMYVHPTGATPRLDTTAPEWEGRAWDAFGGPLVGFSWTPGGPARQVISSGVTHLVSAMVAHPSWTLAGGSLAFAFATDSVTNPDNQYLHRAQDGFPPMLEITYTPPASDGKQTVVNLQENSNMTRNVGWDGAFSLAPYGFNEWWGAYVQPSYAYLTSPAPPRGGKALRLTAGNGRAMIHLGVPKGDEAKWYNASVYVYVPSGAPDVRLANFGDRIESPGNTTSLKNQWVRLSTAFISDGNGGSWVAVDQTDALAGSNFYIANVQLTEGKLLRPYVDGAITIAGADMGWAGAVGNNGFARSVPPTVTLNPIGDLARRKYYSVRWNYAQAQSMPQSLVNMKVRKVSH